MKSIWEMFFYRRPIRLMFLQRRELLIMELFLSTMLKITMKQSFQLQHNIEDVLNGDSTATLEYIDQRMAELQEKLVMCINKNAEYDVIAREIDALREKKATVVTKDLEKVCIQPKYNYCTGEERFTFIKLPKCLVEDEGFIELSMDAKLLYAFFLDRVSLSIKKGWIDNQGRVFIYYSIKNICEDLNCGTQKACKLLDELEKVGALERKRQGLGKPNKLYLKKMF